VRFVAERINVRAYGDVKDNTDSGHSFHTARAAYCFELPELTRQMRKILDRMDQLVRVLTDSGFQARKPKGSFFLYVPLHGLRYPGGKRIAFASRKTPASG
jgi:LL-diaminopimelate aminotransferase